MRVVAAMLSISLSLGCAGMGPAGFGERGGLLDGDTTLTFVQAIGAGTDFVARGSGFGDSNAGRYAIGHASAVAARGNDIFVVDRISGHLVHINLAMGEVRVLLTLRDPNTHGVFVTEDLTIYVVDRFDRSIRQLDETGRTLRLFSDPALLPSPVDVAISDWGNSVVVADELNGNLVMFDLLGGAFDMMGANQSRQSLVHTMHAIAATRNSVYILDPGMEEVTRFGLRGNPLGVYGEDQLRLPSALAVDRCDRLFVADRSGQGIFVSLPDMLLPATRVRSADITADQVTDLWLDEDFLFVAAGAEGIRIFRIEPPCPLF